MRNITLWNPASFRVKRVNPKQIIWKLSNTIIHGSVHLIAAANAHQLSHASLGTLFVSLMRFNTCCSTPPGWQEWGWSYWEARVGWLRYKEFWKCGCSRNVTCKQFTEGVAIRASLTQNTQTRGAVQYHYPWNLRRMPQSTHPLSIQFGISNTRRAIQCLRDLIETTLLDANTHWTLTINRSIKRMAPGSIPDPGQPDCDSGNKWDDAPTLFYLSHNIMTRIIIIIPVI